MGKVPNETLNITMEANQLRLLKNFVELCKKNPNTLYTPGLEFYREWLLSLGANLPESKILSQDFGMATPRVFCHTSWHDTTTLKRTLFHFTFMSNTCYLIEINIYWHRTPLGNIKHNVDLYV